MKVLSVIESLGKGGAERVLVSNILELKKLGVNCEVAILFEIDDLAHELESKGVKVHRLGFSYKWNIFDGVAKFFRLQKKNNYDIIHAHLFFAYFYTGISKFFLRNFKSIVTFHNLSYSEYPAITFYEKIRKNIDKLIVINFFDKKTAVSNSVKDHFNFHYGLADSDIDVLFNSFPISTFDDYKKKPSKDFLNNYFYTKRKNFTILTPGRFVEKKGHKYLIEAINLLNKNYDDLLFIFVGKGPLENYIRKESPANLIILPEMPHSDLMKLYYCVDLIVIPSVHEAFGLVVGEAMIMERGIVATNVDGIVEMISNNNEGLLVPPKSSDHLIDAIETLYHDSVLRLKLAENAKNKISHFDTSIIAEKWKTYYLSMLNENF